MMKLITYARKRGHSWMSSCCRFKRFMCARGETLMSNTIRVIAMAKMPSVRASIRVLLSPLFRFVSPTMNSVSECVAMTGSLQAGIEHPSGQKRRALVLRKLLEGNRRTAQQAGDCVRNGRRRAGGEIAEQFGYRPDVPFGHS